MENSVGAVVVSGASGLIGTALVDSLQADGIPVRRLVRHQAENASEISWDPSQQKLNPQDLAGARAVVNLNGASIGKLPWTSRYRRTLIASRLGPTRTVARALRELGSDAPALISGSAVGYYGDQPGIELTESSRPGTTFLAELCVRWEAEALAAASTTRVVLIRTSSVVHKDALLKPLIPLTKLGVAGKLGDGTQSWPWISLEDEVRAIRHLIDHDVEGPVNLSGPSPATAFDVVKELARQLHRPAWLRTPQWALRFALGKDVAESLLLADANVVPAALQRSGFKFTHATVAEAISEALAL